MSYIRTPKKRHYFAVSTAVANDGRLSFGARGLLLYLLSKPSDWTIRFGDIDREGKIARKARTRLIAELTDAGYLVTKLKRENGRFQYEHLLIEAPKYKAPSTSTGVQKDTTVGTVTGVQKDTTVKGSTEVRKGTAVPVSEKIHSTKSYIQDSQELDNSLDFLFKSLSKKEKENIVEQGLDDTPEETEKPADTKEQAREVFEYWQATLDHSKAKFTDDRKAKIRARLREGYSVDDLKTAIDGNKLSAWHRGENPDKKIYDSIDLIFRNAGKVDEFIENTKGTAKNGKAQKLTSNAEDDRDALAKLGLG